jgi:D-alanyl-D-alanine carboxypeptidase (penicillin-binding protein 5/6)
LKNGEKDQFKPVLVIDKKKLNEDGELTAPLKKGDKVGYIKLEGKDGQELQFINGKVPQVDVVIGEDVEKANWFVLTMRGIGGFFGDVWGSISSTVKGWF